MSSAQQIAMAVNARIAAVCHAKHIPVNIVDDAEKCSFFFPALVKRGAFVAGFHRRRKPLSGTLIREQMEDAIPTGFADVIDVMAEVRGRVKQKICGQRKREQVLPAIFRLALEKNGNVSQAEIEEIIRKEGEQ